MNESKVTYMKDDVEVTEFTGEGYLPLVDFKEWRVAYLRYCEELEVKNIDNMQKHNESDEVFVLLEGSCTLFIGGKGNKAGEVHAVKLEPCKIYNVKQGTWHTHTLTKGTTVLIVENRNTCDDNSPKEYYESGFLLSMI